LNDGRLPGKSKRFMRLRDGLEGILLTDL
jgi:hypothetical protein